MNARAPLQTAWLSKQCWSGIEAAVSGNRWAARLECRPLWCDDGQGPIARAIDRGNGEFDADCRWCRDQRAGHRRRGHTDRAEIVGLAVFGTKPSYAIANDGLMYARTNNFSDEDIALMQALVTALQAWSGIQ